MSGEYGWWLFVVGLALGAGLVWILRVSFRRQDDDQIDVERQAEAGWIAETIEGAGGIAPVELVEQILDLHREYLAGPPLPEASYVPELDEPEPPAPEPPSPGSTRDATPV